MTVHYVYRCYDADDVLLYVGCTKNVKRRISQHRRDGRPRASRWLAACMTRYEVLGPYDSLDAGRRTEQILVALEHPMFNIQEQRTPGTSVLGRAAEYLLEHGHIELAEATACTCWQEDREVGAVSPWCVAHNMQVEGRTLAPSAARPIDLDMEAAS